MKISRHDKTLLFEQEFVTLIMMAVLGLFFHFYHTRPEFYLFTLAVGFGLYFWMVYEESIFPTGVKHNYFEHTSSYLMIAQTAIAVQLLSIFMDWEYMFAISLIAGVIMYSIALSRIILFKVVFKAEHKKA